MEPTKCYVHPHLCPHPPIVLVYLHRFPAMGHTAAATGAIAKVANLEKLVDPMLSLSVI